VPAIAGLLAGGLICALEAVLVRLTVGHWIPIGLPFVVFYLLAGLTVAALLAGAWRALGRPVPAPLALVGLTLAGLQLAAGLERVQGVFAFAFSPIVGLIAAVMAALGFVAAVAVGQRLARRTLDGSLPAALALVTAAGLALNRSVYDSFVQPEALLADAGLLALFVTLVGLQRRGPLGLVLAGAGGATALVALVLVWPSAGPEEDGRFQLDAARPPVILIVVDTLREDVFLDVARTTPEGGRFREKFANAAWFSQATAAAPWTVPSMGSIMTGRFPREHGFHRVAYDPNHIRVQSLSPSVPTLGELLDQDGYAGYAFVTNSHMSVGTGMERGLVNLEMLRGPTWKMPLLSLGERLLLVDPEPYRRGDEVVAFVEDALPGLRALGRPLYLWIHLMDPHEPLRRHRDLAEDPGGAGLAELDRLYRDEVRYTLDQVARLIEVLDGEGLWEEALVFFVSDHGEMFPSDERAHRVEAGQTEPGYGHGYAMYDELVRVPLLIRLPGGRGGEREVDVLASHVDVLPTVLDVVGAEVPEGVRGISLRRFVEGGGALGPRDFVLVDSVAYGPDQRALRSRGLKFVEWPGGEFGPELFDLQADPRERTNLGAADVARSRDVGAKLRSLWKALPAAIDSEERELDAATQRRLEALGYL
jgi:arylsulfatase A-like enzyme